MFRASMSYRLSCWGECPRVNCFRRRQSLFSCFLRLLDIRRNIRRARKIMRIRRSNLILMRATHLNQSLTKLNLTISISCQLNLKTRRVLRMKRKRPLRRKRKRSKMSQRKKASLFILRSSPQQPMCLVQPSSSLFPMVAFLKGVNSFWELITRLQTKPTLSAGSLPLKLLGRRCHICSRSVRL